VNRRGLRSFAAGQCIDNARRAAECYALRGEVSRPSVRTIDLGQGQLYAREWWYAYLASPDQARLKQQPPREAQ
jgi:hypothetical protein